MPQLQNIAENIWVVSTGHAFLGLHAGTRGLSASRAVTRLYLKLCGLEGKIIWGGPYRLLYRDRKAARACIDRLLEWPFERVVIAHGNLILRHAHESIEHGMAWLKA